MNTLHKNCSSSVYQVSMNPSDFKKAVVKPLLQLKETITRSKYTEKLQTLFESTCSVKTSEKYVLQQLVLHSSTYNLPSIQLSAYRSGHSTETVCLCILNDFPLPSTTTIQNLLLLDLPAAFDTTDHGILLSRINTILAKLVLILPFSQELRHPCRD